VLRVLRVLADWRRSLGEDHSRMICQLHQLLLELIPGGAKKALSAAQAKVLLARVRPRDLAGQARRRVAAGLVSDLERIYQRKKAADKELAAALTETGTTLMTLDEIGPSGAARLLAEARADHDAAGGPVLCAQTAGRAVVVSCSDWGPLGAW
jgi:transposase